ncbi:MAG: 50S ribosomal protein L2 [Candidatus Levybacteria bacterium RIFCSPHIGHO2_02_FULL_40_18]|nr:MAG: 50S ribosomal protein L2 [Candidatus Levybacteria bacterium RIFCSPHIGHO2_01_FULL_40_58]OGH26387.1 MAG: 50S ribosomal protein L2 [Candidatus Levybacteria bacterium RIFCSPHIGHO2_02_FULL_40_18]OGH31834.1 MAG: 50S ribosomal protein L2 [Candidatus Levybacteria bacterium RIFCSPHIGHO2_12_FULL_40_31]OGH40467.1 MAG: 50S ribosomal protein L2 [Candidatus Levybacteria bacterium RIFCSPLOWO2_01_FULL_40_64]OGH49176.1 MAG: 50S ribosomal protein L2 [Candidatus Levybacteria bacterium RIFCSPLOWO2_02_FULL_
MVRKLKKILKKQSGRDSQGHVAVRHQGGRHKRFMRVVDFKRDKFNVPGTVTSIEYDPNRSADLAFVQYQDGEKRYILAPLGLSMGDKIVSGESVDIRVGNAMPLGKIPIGQPIHNIELTHGRGGQIARSAGDQAFVMAHEDSYAHVKMPSGEIRKILMSNFATIGQLGKIEWKDRVLGKAGVSRHMGIRPTVRGVAMNPRSHPHGGGEGRSGIGLKYPKTYAGRKAVGKTRLKKKYSNKFILKRRK